MTVQEIVKREYGSAFGYTDDRRMLKTYGEYRRILKEIQDADNRFRRAVLRFCDTFTIAVDCPSLLLEAFDTLKEISKNSG